MFLISIQKLILPLIFELNSAVGSIITLKKKFVSNLALVLSLLFAVSPTFAYDGNDLLAGLNEKKDLFAEGYAWGRIAQVNQVAVNVGIAGRCIVVPKGTKGQQTIDIVKLFLEANPARRQQDALLLIWAALSKAYPTIQVDASGVCPL